MPGQVELQALLDREVQNLQALLDILQREHSALLEADVQALERVTQSKNQLLSSQLTLLNQRKHLTLSLCGDNTEASLQGFISASGDPALAQAYEEVLALAAQSNTQNRNNGRLISQRQRYTRGALDILRHTDPGVDTYSHSGKSDAQGQAGRTLGKA